MVTSKEEKTQVYNKNKYVYESNNLDLVIFLAYIDKIKQIHGLTNYGLLKRAGINIRMVSNIKYLLSGKTIYKPSLTIHLLLKLFSVYNVPFNLSDYIHLIDKKD